MPAAAAPAIIGAVGTVGAAGIQAATAGGGSSVSGFQLPPEYELQLLDQFDQNISDAQRSYQEYGMAADAYTKRLDVYQKQLSNLMPSAQAQRELAQTNMQLVQSLGKDANELVKNGFMTQADIDQMQQLQGIGRGEYQNQVTENQIADQKRQLEQDLSRAGVSPTQRQIALSQFEQGAQRQREQAGNTQFARVQSILSGQSQLRQQGFNQALGTLGAQNQALGMIWQGTQARMGIDQAKYGVAGDQQKIQREQRQDSIGQYQELGKFVLSDRTQNALAGGQLQPGGSQSTATSQFGSPTRTFQRTSAQPGSSYQSFNTRLGRTSTMASDPTSDRYMAEFSRLSDSQLQSMLPGAGAQFSMDDIQRQRYAALEAEIANRRGY